MDILLLDARERRSLRGVEAGEKIGEPTQDGAWDSVPRRVVHRYGVANAIQHHLLEFESAL
jgi:hypothetical protein